jgi:hypothetical protein
MTRLQMLKVLGVPGDVRDWLVRRLTGSEIDKERIGCLAASETGTSKSLWARSALAFAKQLESLQDDDEVWEFRSPAESWSHLCGRSGLCIRRNDEILAIHLILIS